MDSMLFPDEQAFPDLRTIGSHPDYWYPVAWSEDVKAGKVIATSWAGEPIALYRAKSGTLSALEDRCAHRQVPLSMGVVEGESLRCGYHGWTYDRAGKCTDVPYLGACKLPNGIKSYPVREIDGMILVFPGNRALADARAPAALGSAGDAAYKTRRLDRQVACHYTFLHENLFDMNHQFLHRKNMGSIKATCLGRRTGEDWCEVDYTFTRQEGKQSAGEAAILSTFGKADNNRRDLMTIRTQYPYQHLRVWVGQAKEPMLNVWLCYTPLDKEQRTNRTFGFLSVKKAKIPGLTQLAWPVITWFTERIFEEDRTILEAEQRAWDQQGCDRNNEVFPVIRDLRATLARCGMRKADGPVAARVRA